MDAYVANRGGEVPFPLKHGYRTRSRPCAGRPESSQEWPTDNVSYYGDIDTASEDDCEGSNEAENLEYYGDFTGCTKEDLLHECLIAKRRFRKFTGRQG